MGFPLLFVDLLYECISTPSFSVLIDGSPFGIINSSRGLRQGDPLLPYLFSIAMEHLTILFDMEYLNGNLLPIYQNEPIITHLLYAHDILVLTKATICNAESMKHIFLVWENVSGLNLNANKSTLFFSKKAKHKIQIANILNINIGNLPFIYLGIPLSYNKLKARDFGWLIDKINK